MKLSTPALWIAVSLFFASPMAYPEGGNSNRFAQPSDYKKAVKLIKKEDYATAIPLLEQVLEKNPKNANAWNYLGFSLRSLKEYDDALIAYDKALTINPKHKGALEYLGELYLNTGQPELAKAQLAKLDEACFFSCKELRKLKKRIAEYSGGP